MSTHIPIRVRFRIWLHFGFQLFGVFTHFPRYDVRDGRELVVCDGCDWTCPL
jgi:hypothetical protein